MIFIKQTVNSIKFSSQTLFRQRSFSFKYCAAFSTYESSDQQQNAFVNPKNILRKDDIYTVALVGKPNVGKSSLFNKLSGGEYAITDQMPGLTRDRKEVITKILGFPIRLVDTAGIDQEFEKQMHSKRNEFLLHGDKLLRQKMINQTKQAMLHSDLTLFIIDAKEGLTPQDHHLARYLTQNKKQLLKEEMKKIKQEQQQEEEEENTEEGQTNIETFNPANKLRQIYKNEVLLIANKCDIEETQDEVINDVYQLGLGEPLFISAENGEGLTDLLAKIRKSVPEGYENNYEDKRLKRMEKHLQLRNQIKDEIKELRTNGKIPDDFDIKEWEYEFDLANKNPEENSDLDSDAEVDPKQNMSMGLVPNEFHSDNIYSKKPIQISIVGRANAGKSTLTNTLLKQDRVIVDDLEGTTRDAISIQWVYKDRKVVLVDTAGIDKKMKHKSRIDEKCYESTMKSIRYSSVVICMVDALKSFQVQDLAVAQFVAEEGRGLILLINKWDLVPQAYRKKMIRYMEKQLEQNLAQVQGIKLMCISAKNGFNLEGVMDEVLSIYSKWNVRINTGVLNDWLNRFKKTQQTPAQEGEILKVRFVSQIKTRPPTFALFEFGFEGVPIRLLIRDTIYKKNKKKFEQQNPGSKIKDIYRQKRKISGSLKNKLESL